MTEMERSSGDARELFPRWFAEWPWPRWAEGRGFRLPAWAEPDIKVEEFTEGNELVVRAEMPGVDPEKDVEITVGDHTLRLRAERREETKTEEKGRYRSEFRYGSFSRVVDLPPGVSAEDVKATYKDGVLEVRIPLDAQRAEATKIAVQRA